MGRDALYVAWDGGGGYGDPLERDPAAVLADVREKIVSPEAAKSLYGVVVDRSEIDTAATAQLRQRIRGERMMRQAAE
jgi:N-methylhydantoinase B